MSGDMTALVLSPAPRAVLPDDPGFPIGFKSLASPPLRLDIAGELPDLTRAVAIVGTRYADPDALQFAQALAGALSEAGCPIVSGGAAGVDSAAHVGALAVGGPTVAVLATGLKRAYPSENKGLFEQIAGRGALLSEPGDRRGSRGAAAFLERNRLIAALAQCVVVVQAPARSGALSTARWAKQLKKRVLAVPAAPWDPRGTGCLQLLSAGAEICTSAADVLSLAPFELGKRPKRRAKHSEETNDYAGLPAGAQRLWRWLRGQRCYPDQIAAALDMPAAEVQEALLTLVLAGRCQQRADGCYQVTAARLPRAT